MTIRDITAAMLDALNATATPYLLVGSFSSSFYGIPRSTKDADFVIEVGNRSVSFLSQHLPPEFKLDRQMQFEGVTGTYKNLVTVEGTEFSIELFRLSRDPHDQERFRRRVQVPLLERAAWLPTAEDVVITKLRWFRSKDRDDIRDVIAVQKDRLDWDYLHRWCDAHDTRQLVDEILASLPPA